ncbi:DNA-directed RNA polymerase, mitochondrial [Geodia barretti]|nr:DNA-directed RNA polymerase, mitochondrial [Geodia barretti]
MEWVTPLGLPVVQPYHKMYQKSVSTQLQGLNMRVAWNPSYPPDTRKQKNAMPPNFVHSLDSTHMMLTALHAHRAGISFVAVHDSYWTHACFVDTMNRLSSRHQETEECHAPQLCPLSGLHPHDAHCTPCTQGRDILCCSS